MTQLAYVNTLESKCSGVLGGAFMLGHDVLDIDGMPEMYKKVCEPDFYPALTLIDLQSLLDIDDIDILDQVMGLALAMRCQEPDWKLKMALVVRENNDINLIRRLRKLPEVMGIITNTDSLDTVAESLSQWLEGHKFVSRSADKLIRITKKTQVEPGEIVLTERQQQILEMISTKGMSNKSIAKLLKISESTVKLHVSAILKRYGLRNRTQLAVYSKEK